MNDEALQKQIEAGETNLGPDGLAYEKVFRALSIEHPVLLSNSFSENVIRRVAAKQRMRLFIEEYLMLILATATIISAGIYCVAISQFKFSFGFLSGLSSYAGVLGFGFVFIMVFNVVERKLLHSKNEARSSKPK